jgi:uncharacterized protein YbjQ (UPF0145 family)
MMSRRTGSAGGPTPSEVADNPWSSSLSVAEFAAVQQTGFEPAGLVIGASAYRFGEQAVGSKLHYQPRYGVTGIRHVSTMAPHPQDTLVSLPSAWAHVWQQTYKCKHVGSGHVPGINYEDEPFESAVTEAYELARDRLRGAAVDCGAHGVIAATVAVQHPPLLESSAPTAEIRLIGTALKVPGAEPLERPFVAHLSGQAFAKLIGLGLVPVDTRIGVGAVRSYFGCAGSQKDIYMRQEFVQRTDAMQRSREQAINMLTSPEDATGLTMVGATPSGPFGTKHSFDHFFEYSVVGTQVVRFDSAEQLTPRVAIGLGGR